MYNISNTATKSAVEAALAAQTRVFKHRISFGSLSAAGVFTAQKTIDEGIISLHISQQINGNGSGLVMGCCCAACADAEFYNPDKIFVYEGKTLFVECGIQLEDGSFYYIPLGYYKTEKPESDDDYYTVKIKCYDAVNAMTGKWQSALSFPSATAYDILFEAASKYGVGIVISSSIMRTKLRNRYVTAEETAILGQYTDREVIGILAGLVGCNARINTVGKLAIGWYSGSVSIPAELQWQNGFKKTQEAAFTISSVTSGSDDNVFTAGTGSGISFVNPIITEDEITAIYGEISDYEFQPCECEWRGNPCVEVGDMAVVTDRKGKTYSVYIAAQELDLTGGLSSTVSCPAGDAEVSFDTVDERTRSALNKQRTTLQEAIIAASNAINGALGGYLKIGDSDGDGNPDYMLITENANGEAVSGSATNGYIMFNKAGIGLSVDGGKTYRTAITFSGINADCITTGKLSADLIDTSRLVVGGEHHDSLEGFLNAMAETTDSSVTNVDVLYARNQSATEAPADTAWSTDPPTWAEGYYIWTKTKITAGGTDSCTEPVCITGAKGAQGADGKAGRGVTKIEEQYYLSTSDSTQTGGSWSTAQPEWREKCYIWTRSRITWSDKTTSYTDPVLAKAINGANSAVKLLEGAGFCKKENKVYIDGSKIYAGSVGATAIAAGAITAEKVNVGWQSGNLASDWYNPNGLTLSDYFTIDADDSNNYYSKVYVKTVYSGTLRCCSKPFYLAAGDQLKYGGEIYNKTATLSGFYIEYSSTSNGAYSVKVAANSSSAGKSEKENYTYIASESGWYRFTCAFDNPAAGTYHSGVYCFRSVKGNLIVNGRIESTDGNTYFDLDEGSIYSTATYYQTGFRAGSIITLARVSDSSKYSEAGGFEAATDNTYTWQQIRWNGKANSLRIGYGDSSNIEPYITCTTPGTIELYKPLYALDIMSTGQISASNFVSSGASQNALSHTYETDNNTLRLLGGVVNYAGVGYKSVAISTNSGDGLARLDVSTSWGSAMGVLSLWNGSSRSASLELGSSQIWFNRNELTASSSEKYKTDIQPYTDSALSLIDSSTVYSYKYKSDGENALTKYGLVIERECPEEVIDNSGDAICLYSMCSILWKSVQELNAKIEALGGENNA